MNSCEEQNSVNALEPLGVVWSVEYFKNYLYGKHFTFITVHRAVLSILKEKHSNKSYNSRSIRWIDRLLTFHFDIVHLPGAKMGLVDYISRHPNQKAKKVSAYDEDFIVTKLKPISASVGSLDLNNSKPASQLHKLIQAHDPAHQITPKNEALDKAINLISTHAARVHKRDYNVSLATLKQATNTNPNLSNSKYAYPASRLPINTSLAMRNTFYCKQPFQNWNDSYLAKRETQFN